MSNKEKGNKGENIALEYLLEKGYSFVAKNVRLTTGEIDIVCKKSNELVFIEVKYRVGIKQGTASEAITPRKKARLFRAAEEYIASAGWMGSVRFAAVLIEDLKGERSIEMIEDIFL